MAEMRDEAFAGLDRERAGEMILCYQDNQRSGQEFFTRTVEPLLRLHKPDLLWIDPALSYICGESNSLTNVGRFLRNKVFASALPSDTPTAGVHPANASVSGVDTPEDRLLRLLDRTLARAWNTGNPLDELCGSAADLMAQIRAALPEQAMELNTLLTHSSAAGQLLAKIQVAHPARLSRKTLKGTVIWRLEGWADE